MGVIDRKMLKMVYGLDYGECSKVFKLMRTLGLGIDEAARRVKKERDK